MSSSVPAVKRALALKLRDLFPEAGTTYGPPTEYPNEMAAVGDARSEVTQPTTGGATRSRDEVVETQVILSCYVPGPERNSGDEVFEENPSYRADLAAYAMLDALEDHFRDPTVQTLGGLVREAMITSHEGTLLLITDDQNNVTGRVSEITATVRTVTRI